MVATLPINKAILLNKEAIHLNSQVIRLSKVAIHLNKEGTHHQAMINKSATGSSSTPATGLQLLKVNTADMVLR